MLGSFGAKDAAGACAPFGAARLRDLCLRARGGVQSGVTRRVVAASSSRSHIGSGSMLGGLPGHDTRRSRGSLSYAAAAATVGGASATVGVAAAGAATLADLLPRLPPGASFGNYTMEQLAAIPAGRIDPELAMTTMTMLSAPFRWAITTFHDGVGLPWFAAIAATAATARLLTMPVAMSAMLTASRLAEHQDAYRAFAARMQEASARQDSGAVLEASRERVAYARLHKLQMYRVFAPLLLQTPIFIGLFTATRKFASEAHLFPGFVTGGAAWFPLLHMPDPAGMMGGLPFFAGATSVAAVLTAVNLTGMPQLSLTAPGQRLLFATLAAAFAPVAANFPASTQIYIATAAVGQLLQNSLLRSVRFRDWFGFSRDWPPTGAKLAAQQASNAGALRLADSMRALEPIFRVASHYGDAIARGDWRTVIRSNPVRVAQGHSPKLRYITFLGHRDPGIPPPPPTQLLDAPQAVAGSAASGPQAVKPSSDAVAGPPPPAPPAARRTSARGARPNRR